MANKRRSGLANDRRVHTCCQRASRAFIVTYNGNADASGNTPTDSTIYKSGVTVTVLGNTGNLENPGYTFAGWNTSADGTGTTYSQGSTFLITANTTLYAKWTPIPPPSAPTALSSVGGNTEAYILFTQVGTVTNYEYSTDNGVTFLAFNPPQIYSPVNITALSSDGTTPLTNGVTYTVILKAVNSGVSSAESSSVDVTPASTSLASSNRIVYLDTNNSSSYSGTGTTWTNLESSGSYSASLVGSPSFNTATSNKYFEFNPGVITGQYAQINQDAAINPAMDTPFTIQLWARINNVGTTGTLVSKMLGSNYDYDGYNFSYLANNALQLHMNGSSRDSKFPTLVPGVLSSGWALYTANIQFGGLSRIFVNGRLVRSDESGETGLTHKFQNLTIAGGFNGDGELDVGEFYYYNTELSHTQIIQNFDATKHRYL